VAEIITAIEGPIALTECSTDCPSRCDLEPVCPVRDNWRKINHVICNALENLSLFQMARELPRQPPLVVLSGKTRSA
jgi:DNA-binding IscR family transcriptional regulator